MITYLKSNWKVKLTNDKKLLRVNGKIGKGAVHYKDCTIYLDESATINQLSRVIRHELAHVIIYETQIQQKDSYSEEDMCEFMALYAPIVEVNARELIQRIEEAKNNKELLAHISLQLNNYQD